jgi:hypothetical protein
MDRNVNVDMVEGYGGRMHCMDSLQVDHYLDGFFICLFAAPFFILFRSILFILTIADARTPKTLNKTKHAEKKLAPQRYYYYY